jgi:hypothetical protein
MIGIIMPHLTEIQKNAIKSKVVEKIRRQHPIQGGRYTEVEATDLDSADAEVALHDNSVIKHVERITEYILPMLADYFDASLEAGIDFLIKNDIEVGWDMLVCAHPVERTDTNQFVKAIIERNFFQPALLNAILFAERVDLFQPLVKALCAHQPNWLSLFSGKNDSTLPIELLVLYLKRALTDSENHELIATIYNEIPDDCFKYDDGFDQEKSCTDKHDGDDDGFSDYVPFNWDGKEKPGCVKKPPCTNKLDYVSRELLHQSGAEALSSKLRYSLEISAAKPGQLGVFGSTTSGAAAAPPPPPPSALSL